MGKGSGIAWTDHTFNPWWGCVKVSPACTNCYAATFDRRLGGDHWGPKSDRKFFGDKHWNEPLKWNREAEAAGVRAKVFCASMADVFEDRPELVGPRARLWKLILKTRSLDWLLLTKRPENLSRMLPWIGAFATGRMPSEQAEASAREASEPWPNVWLGTTVENQEYADIRIPKLLAVPAAIRFLSCEPLLGPIDLGLPKTWLVGATAKKILRDHGAVGPVPRHLTPPPSLDWIIVGAESGHGARPQNIDAFRSLRDQCAEAGTAFFFKQAFEDLTMANVADGQPITRGSITAGSGSWRKGGGLIEQPYLDSAQHIAFPEVRHV